MFKLLFRVRFGSRWLLAGVRTSGLSILHGHLFGCGVVDYTISALLVRACLIFFYCLQDYHFGKDKKSHPKRVALRN